MSGPAIGVSLGALFIMLQRQVLERGGGHGCAVSGLMGKVAVCATYFPPPAAGLMLSTQSRSFSWFVGCGEEEATEYKLEGNLFGL